jgi:hypothetical protein
MKWVIIGVVIIIAYIFVMGLCKIASDSDDRMEEMWKERNK